MDILKILQGEEYYNKNKEFEEALSQIEKKYIDFFKNRPPKFESEEHDRLHNHYIILGNNQSIRFGFDKESDIPEYIKTECNQAFIKIFGTDDK